MKILVTGGAGFIGSHLVDRLLEKHDVVVIDNLSTGLKENMNPKAIFYQENLGDYKKIKEVFEKEKFDVIYHLAAQINVRKSVEDPIEDAKINILNTLNLLELAVKYNVKHFIFSSTGGAIYGSSDKLPIPEIEEERPESPYGCAKLAIEKYLHFYNATYGLKFTALRYSNVYGERQNPRGEAGVVSLFFDKMFSGQNPIIFGSGEQTRDYVYVKDVVEANLLALNDKKSEIYNVATEVETSVLDVFNKVNHFFNNKFKPVFENLRKGEVMRNCLSYKKINENLGWTPKTDFDTGLKKCYEWYLSNRQASAGD